MKNSINTPITLFWFRRDLRLQDNTGLYAALSEYNNVQPIFIFDTNILDDLDKPADRRVSFIYENIEKIKTQLMELGSDLWVFHGSPHAVFERLLAENRIEAVYTNTDYEPYALQRDSAIAALCMGKNISFHTFKDQVIFEKLEIAKNDGTPYTVFTPFMRKWKIAFEEKGFVINSLEHLSRKFNTSIVISPSVKINQLGFTACDHDVSLAEFPLNI